MGDALAQFRTHVGSTTTTQAALDALLLEKVLKGKVRLDQWGERVLQYADLTRLRSIAFGNFYMNGHLTFTPNVVKYMWMFGTQKLWRRWYWSAYPFPGAMFSLL